MLQFNSLIGREQTWQQEFDEACSLTREQRMYGFGACFVTGWILSIIVRTEHSPHCSTAALLPITPQHSAADHRTAQHRIPCDCNALQSRRTDTDWRFLSHSHCPLFCVPCGQAITQIPSIPVAPQNFALLYSIGNIVALLSTCFLFGPCNQIKKMFDAVRIWATLIYLAAIGLTLFCAFKVQEALPVIACMIVQVRRRRRRDHPITRQRDAARAPVQSAVQSADCPLSAVRCPPAQLLAMIWYCASYIPYGRKCLQNCVGSICQV
jgi:hypothetical protein